LLEVPSSKRDRTDLKRDRTSLKWDHSGLKCDRTDLKCDRSDLKCDRSDLKRDRPPLMDMFRRACSEGHVQKTGADLPEILDFPLPQLGFTQKSEHSPERSRLQLESWSKLLVRSPVQSSSVPYYPY
jgi:hypothetical protein